MAKINLNYAHLNRVKLNRVNDEKEPSQDERISKILHEACEMDFWTSEEAREACKKSVEEFDKEFLNK